MRFFGFKKFYKIRLKAFSLLEISVYIAIVGILVLSLSKVKDVMQSAKIQATIMQIQTIIIKSTNESSDFESNSTFSKEELSPKIGGKFLIYPNLLILAKNDKKEGILTEEQAKKIEKQIALNECTIEKTNNELYIISVQF